MGNTEAMGAELGEAEGTDLGNESEGAEESDIRNEDTHPKSEKFTPADLYSAQMGDETPGEWLNSASEAINKFINDPDFLFAKVTRFCLDCRAINDICLKSHFWPQTVSKLVHGMEEMQVACKLDLLQAFHNLVLAEESRDLTSFQCAFGKFRY